MWRVRLVAAFFLATFLAVLLLAILYLPGWAWLLIAALVILIPMLLRLLIRWKVRSFFRELNTQTPPGMPPGIMALFKMKGSVLRKARVEVHAVHPVEAPPPEPSAGSDGEPRLPGPEGSVAPSRDYYLLDVTIRPTRWGIGFKRWQPGELALTTPTSGLLEPDDSCEILNVQVEHGGRFEPEDEMRYAGPQRLRLLVTVRRGVGRLAFRYYTEQFGEVVLPGGNQLPST
jgi:hypothetical protein